MSKIYQGDTSAMQIDKQVIDLLDQKHSLLTKQFQIVQELEKQSKEELLEWEKQIKDLKIISNQCDFSNVEKILHNMEIEAQLLGNKAKSKLVENIQNVKTHLTEPMKKNDVAELINKNSNDKKQPFIFEQEISQIQEAPQAINDYIPRSSVGPQSFETKQNLQKNNQLHEEQYKKQMKPNFQENERYVDEKIKKQVKPFEDSTENIFEDQPNFQMKTSQQDNEQRQQLKSKYLENTQDQKSKELKQPIQHEQEEDDNFEEEKVVEDQNYKSKFIISKSQRNPANNPQKKIVPPSQRTFDQPIKKIKISQPLSSLLERDYDNQHKVSLKSKEDEEQSGDMAIFEDQVIQYLSKVRGDTPEVVERQLRKAQYFKETYGINDSILTISPQWLKSFKNKFLAEQ